MADDDPLIQISLKIPESLLKRVDKFVAVKRKKYKERSYSRTDALLRGVDEYLEREEHPERGGDARFESMQKEIDELKTEIKALNEMKSLLYELATEKNERDNTEKEGGR